MNDLSAKSTAIGAASNRLESTLESLAVDIENTTSSLSTIKDADILAQDKVISAPSGYTLKLGGDIVPSEEKTANGTMTGEIFSYTSAGNTEGFRVVDGTIKYFTDERTSFEISGLDTKAELGKNISVSGDKITISKDALATKNATLSSTADYTMELDDVSAPTKTDEGWSNLTYQTSAVSAEGYEIDGNTIKYYPVQAAKNLFTLSGVRSNSGFTVSKDGTAYTVKVADSAVANLNDETTVTLTDIDKNITANFAFDSGFTGEKTLTQNAAATLENGVYTSKTYKAYSEIDGANLTFHPATTAKEFTITNLSDSAKLGENVIVTDGETTKFEFKTAALDKKSVEISGGTFTVELNENVDTTAETIDEIKNVSDGTLNYTSGGTGEYYEKTSNGVEYHEQSGGESFTLSGVTNAEGVTVSGKNVTVTNDAFDMLAAETYDVEFANVGNADFVLTFNANTSTESVDANYKNGAYSSAHSSAYFTNTDDGKYTFTPSVNVKTFNITGLNIDGEKTGAAIDEYFTVGDDTVTVKKAALGTDNIAITSGNFKLALDNDAEIITSKTVDKEIALTKDGDNYKYTAESYKAYYQKTSDTQITYNQPSGGETLFTVSGLGDNAKLNENVIN